ncbi:MAG: hypothetical protein ACRC0X_04690 [Brevinema sp.]
MKAVLFLYFTALIKRIVVLLLLGAFIPLMLLAFDYPWNIILPIFRDILLIALPWFLWFHQVVFCGFTTFKTTFSQFLLIMLSSCLSALLLIGIFPYTQKELPLVVEQIRPNITMPKGSIITSPRGTLIINSLQQSLFTNTNTKALWVHSNFSSFQEIRTNSQSFDLSLPESDLQESIETIPFYRPYPSYQLGQTIIQTWFDNITILNKNIRALYESIEVPLPLSTNQQFLEILTIKAARSNTSQNLPLFQEYSQYKTFSQQSKQEFVKEEAKNWQGWIFDYLNIFLSLLCIFSIASLLGIVTTIQQNFLGSIALLSIISLYAPVFSTKIINVSLKLHDLQPSYSILLINLLLVGLLYLCTMILTSIKKQQKGVPH